MTRNYDDYEEVTTPWGPSQDSIETIPGVTWHSTAGHGGYHLSPERQLRLLKTFGPVNDSGWYEEDCEWSMVVLAFADEFEDEKVAGAVETARSTLEMASAGVAANRIDGRTNNVNYWLVSETNWQKIIAWLEIAKAGQRAQCRYVKWTVLMCEHWRVSGMGTPPKGSPASAWSVRLKRGQDKRTVLFARYPNERYYTDAELANAAVPATFQVFTS